MVLGLMLGTIAAILLLLRVLAASKSEGARRLRLVLKLVVLVGVLAVLIDAFGVMNILGWCAALAVMAWVYRGFKKS